MLHYYSLLEVSSHQRDGVMENTAGIQCLAEFLGKALHQTQSSVSSDGKPVRDQILIAAAVMLTQPGVQSEAPFCVAKYIHLNCCVSGATQRRLAALWRICGESVFDGQRVNLYRAG